MNTKVLNVALIGAIVVLIAGCTPHINSIEPNHGYVGDSVSIKGRYFSKTPTDNTVTFSGTPTAVVAPSSSILLNVIVPNGAVTGPVVVKVGKRSSNAVPFTVHSGARAVSGIVESMGNVGNMSSLVLDSADRPHIAYLGNGTMYATWDGTKWIYETVDSDIPMWLSLTYSGAGNPCVSYSIVKTFSAQGLRYARQDSSGWTIEDVDPTDNAGMFNSLALTKAGDPRIVQFRGGVGGGLFFSEFIGNNWSTKRIKPTPSGYTLGQNCSLVLDSADNPRIVFYERNSGAGDQLGSVNYAWRSSNTWNEQKVETMTYQNWTGTSIVLDSGDNPRVSYCWHGANPTGQSELRYAKLVGGNWIVEPVVKKFTWRPSLALDNSGNPTIGYYERDHPNNVVYLKYARWNGNNWKITSAHTWNDSGYLFGYPLQFSLALDSRGKAHISYYDIVNGDLLYYAES